MSDTVYRSIVGFVAFDPEVTEINGTPLLKFRMSGIGLKGQPLITISVWGENNSKLPISRGDFIAVNGAYTSSLASGGGTVYHNLKAYSLVHMSNELEAPNFDKVPVKTSSGKDPF